MTPYEIGAAIALEKLAATYPEEYNAAGSMGAIGGGTAGALAGGALGEMVAKRIGHMTRQKHLGIPFPGTGFGERFFSASPGPVMGQAMGAALGGAAGAGMGFHGGHLTALRRSGPPHQLVNPQGQVDPQLLDYLLQMQGGAPQAEAKTPVTQG